MGQQPSPNYAAVAAMFDQLHELEELGEAETRRKFMIDLTMEDEET